MKIEFRIVGDGTNIQVSLIETFPMSEGAYFVKDSFYTATHKLPLIIFVGGGLHWEEAFEKLEDSMEPPIIAGEYAHLHPYWEQRRAVREKRKLVQNLDS
jgi:hypothetical protein